LGVPRRLASWFVDSGRFANRPYDCGLTIMRGRCELHWASRAGWHRGLLTAGGSRTAPTTAD